MGKNATSFKKGVIANPDGRPKGAMGLKTKLRVALDKIHEGTGSRYDELLIESIMKDAIKGNDNMRRLIWNYLEGMPRETKDITVKLPQPLLGGKSKDGTDNDSNKQDTKTQEED